MPDDTQESGEEVETEGDDAEGEEAETDTESEESEDDAEESEESDDDADEEDGDEEPEDDGESEDAEAEDEPENTGKKRLVPYSRLKSERNKNKALRNSQTARLADALDALTKHLSGNNKTAPTEEADEVVKAAKDLAREIGVEESGMGEKQLEAVLRAAMKLAGKNTVSADELAQMRKALSGLEKNNQSAAEQVHFDKEWKSVVPNLRKMFPNATPEMLEEAKQKMDQIAHSAAGGKIIKENGKEIFVPHDLDFILFRNKKTFRTILSAKKGKSGESSHEIFRESTENAPAGDGDIDPRNLTPDSFKSEEAREQSAYAASGGRERGRIHRRVSR
jgi:hypothetical protein